MTTPFFPDGPRRYLVAPDKNAIEWGINREDRMEGTVTQQRHRQDRVPPEDNVTLEVSVFSAR